MIISDPRPLEYQYVLDNLSTKSQEDLFSANEASTEEMCNWMFFRDGFRWCFYHDGKPAAILGALEVHNGVWNLYGAGTNDWQKVWRQVTLTAKRDMMSLVLDAGAHRAQCLSPAHHSDTHKWLRYLGATHEVQMPQYGMHGEDFIMFAWLKNF